MAIVNSRAAIEPKTGKAAIFVNETIHSLIRKLFANNEQGFAYDPNDLTTMFQDAAGTIPVTGAGQPVGLMLDKSKGLVLGAELWNDSIVAPTGGSSKISNGVYRIYSSDGAYSAINIGGVLTVGALYKLTFNIDSITLLGTGITNEGNPASIFNSLGKKTVYFFATAAALSLKRAGGACDIQISNVSVKPVAGNHAYQTTSASRPILRQNAVTGAYYLDFDGADDFLVTNSINFTATNKLSLFTGVRKMSATAVNMLCELSSSSTETAQANAFYLAVPETSTGTIFFRSRAIQGSGHVATVESGSGVRNCVITAKSDIPNDLNTIRLDGVLGTPSPGDLGVGNLGNYPLYIGRRGGISLPFNGHIYSLIGVGRLTTDAETKALEKLIAKNTGVTLSV